MPAQKENLVPETTSSGIISAAMAAANTAIGLNPVEDPSVPKDYTLSVPIFQKNHHPPIVITRLRRAVLKEGCDEYTKPQDHSNQTTRSFRPDHKIIQTKPQDHSDQFRLINQELSIQPIHTVKLSETRDQIIKNHKPNHQKS